MLTVAAPVISEPMADDDQDVLERLVRTMELTDQQEDDMLRFDDVETTKAVAVIDQEDNNNNNNNNWADIVAANDDVVSKNCEMKLDLDYAVLFDAQLVYHRGRGMFIKEMAFKWFTSTAMYNVNLAHDTADVPAHLVVKRGSDEQRHHYHRSTGLELKTGDMAYDDRIVAASLAGARVIFLKGANKKSSLISVFDRLEKEQENDGGATVTTATTGSVYTRPTVVNVDAHTANDEDRLMCQTYGIPLAAFSFTYVYANFDAYLNVLLETDSPSGGCTKDVVYVNNVLAADAKYNVSGRGRVVCICHCDHSRGGTVKTFSSKQRCSLLNLSILHNLWYNGLNEVFTAASVRPALDDGGNSKTTTTATTTIVDRLDHGSPLAKRRRPRNGRDSVSTLQVSKTPTVSRYVSSRDRWSPSPIYENRYPYWTQEVKRRRRRRRRQQQQQNTGGYEKRSVAADRRERDDRYDFWYEPFYRGEDDGGYYHYYRYV